MKCMHGADRETMPLSIIEQFDTQCFYNTYSFVNDSKKDLKEIES